MLGLCYVVRSIQLSLESYSLAKFSSHSPPLLSKLVSLTIHRNLSESVFTEWSYNNHGELYFWHVNSYSFAFCMTPCCPVCFKPSVLHSSCSGDAVLCSTPGLITALRDGDQTLLAPEQLPALLLAFSFCPLRSISHPPLPQLRYVFSPSLAQMECILEK